MALTNLNRENLGGNANTPAVKELQGLNVSIVAGTSAAAKIDIAAIRPQDTLLSVIESAAGVLTDRTANTAISDLKASGTLTFVSAVDTDVFEVNGVTYTISTAGGSAHTAVAVGADDTEMAENAVAAINAYENSYDGDMAVTATNALGVVTITANVQGAAGNAITISSVDTTITASAATLENGTDTGGIECSDDTTGDSLIVMWFDKA